MDNWRLEPKNEGLEDDFPFHMVVIFVFPAVNFRRFFLISCSWFMKGTGNNGFWAIFDRQSSIDQSFLVAVVLNNLTTNKIDLLVCWYGSLNNNALT